MEASMSVWLVLAVNSITLGGLLFLLSAGFSLIFGLMRIPNLTHGSLFMLGAYFGATFAVWWQFDFWLAALLSALLIAVIGGVIERFLLRQLHAGQPPQDQTLDQAAEEGDPQPARDGRGPEVEAEAHEAHAKVSAQHEERSVGQVRDLHQAEDQREARGEEEQQAAQRDAVDGQDRDEAGRHERRVLARVIAMVWTRRADRLNSSAGGSLSSTRAAPGTTSRRRSRTGSRPCTS